MATDGRPGDGHPDNDPPLGDIAEFDRGELQSDTLAFERIKRRPPERRRGIIIILVLLVLAGGGYGGCGPAGPAGGVLEAPAGNRCYRASRGPGPF